MKITPIRIALTMIFAILFTNRLGIGCSLVLCGAAVVLSFIFCAVKRNFDLGIFIIVLSFLIPSVSYSYCVSSKNHKTVNYIDRYVTLTGVVTTPAKKSTYDNNFKYTFHVKTISNILGTFDISDDILLTTPQKLKCQDSLEIKGIIKDLPKRMNDNGFDMAKHYKSQNIFTRIYSEEITEIEPISHFSFFALGGRLSEKADSIISENFDGDYGAVLTAVLTGNNNNFSKEYKKSVNNTAFSRLYHPAYIHIWLILTICGALSKLVRRQYRDIALIVLFLVYALFQCAHIGFARCLIGTAIMLFCKLTLGDASFPDTMAIIAIFCAVTMPTIFFNAAFVLSMTYGLIIWAFMPIISKRLLFLPMKLRRTTAAMVISAVLLTPFSAYYFSSICVYTLFAPFITAPIITALLVLSPVCLLLMHLFGHAYIIEMLVKFLVAILYYMPIIIEKLPLSVIHIGKPTLTVIVAFIFAIMLLYNIAKHRKGHVFVLSALTLGISVTISAVTLLRIGTAEFIFVNVGQGDGSIIRTPFKETIIIDGGGGTDWSEYNPGETIFAPYIHSLGCNHVEAAIVSHYHKDHIQGIIATISTVRTDVVFAPVINDTDSESMKNMAKELEEAAKIYNTKIYYVSENTQIVFNDGLTLDIYVPSMAVNTENENDTSLSVKARYGEFSALYTGDLSRKGEIFLAMNNDVDADLLKVSHHGSRYSSGTEFIDAVSPVSSVISCGENNMYSHPHKETLERLSDTEVLRTDLLGDIKIRVKMNGDYHIVK